MYIRIKKDMSKTNYLYLTNVRLPSEDYYGIFSSDFSFDINLDWDTYTSDIEIFNSFRKMIFSDPNIFASNFEDYFINDIKIVSKIDYKLTYNKLIPDNLYKSLSWFNDAIRILGNIYEGEYDDFEEEEAIKTITSHIEKAYTKNIFRHWDTNILKESSFCAFSNRYMQDTMNKIHHTEAILNEILKVIDIESIKFFDTLILEYEKSHNTELENIYRIDFNTTKEIKEIRGGIGHWPNIIPFKNPNSLEEHKGNLLFHIGMFVSEIRLIFSELLDSIMNYKPFQTTHFEYLYYKSFEDVILNFKIRLIKEKKKYIIENQNYGVSLIDLKKEKIENINDKTSILIALSSNFKKQEKIKVLLDDIDEHYYISKSVKFSKRKLAIIAFILQHCEIFNKMSYETFKQNICWYYGKENVSMKPNKIKEEAIQEYYKKEFIYKKYGITI